MRDVLDTERSLYCAQRALISLQRAE